MKIHVKDAPEGYSEYTEDVLPSDVELCDEEGLAFPRPVHVTARLTREGNKFYVHGTVGTTVLMPCARCLGEAQTAVNGEFDGIFHWKQSHNTFVHISDEGDEHQFGGAVLDLSPLVREAVIMAIPIAPLCQPDCAGLCPHCGADLNKEKCTCDDNNIDPRWSALEKLRKQASGEN
jgi:uncharacterized protein